jgi:hypothetical protein
VNAPENFTKPLVELFAAKCAELADRVRAGNLGFIDATDMAYSAACWSGLVDLIGDDEIQKIMTVAFGCIPRGGKT